MSGIGGARGTPRGYAVSRAPGGGREGVFPIRGTALPPMTRAAGELPQGATWSCGRGPVGVPDARVSDGSVGGPPPHAATPQEAAPRRQARRSAGVTPPRFGVTYGKRGAARGAAARSARKSSPGRCFGLDLHAPEWLTAKGPEVDSNGPNTIMKSGTCEPKGQPDGLAGQGWTVQASTADRSARSGREATRSRLASPCTLLTSFTHPPCATRSGGFSPEAELPHEGLRGFRSGMPGGEMGRGTRLAVISRATVPR